jgi:glucose-6-phosphate 1-epimerase
MANELIHTINHTASGASIQVSAYGATLTSYKSKQREHIFVSKLALLDGSAPVRGGIPLVFPIFGPTAVVGSTMPQHGFARRNLWTALNEYDTQESAGITYQLSLSQTSAGRGDGNIWSASDENKGYDCTLLYDVEFNGDQMTCKLTIQNTGKNAFPFQCLLHTYYKVEENAALNPNQCYVQGLEGYICDDKVTKVPKYAHNAEPITIAGEVDRVYAPPSDGDKDNVNATIGVGNHMVVTMEASGKVDDVTVPISCVVWNPYIEKAAGLADFDNDEYHDMLCVEPGILGNDIVLHPGKEAYLQQVMKV